MGTNAIIGVIVALVVVAGGYVFFMSGGSNTNEESMTTNNEVETAEKINVAMDDKETETNSEPEMETKKVMQADESVKEVKPMAEVEEEMVKEEVAEVTKPGTYTTYSPDKLAMAETGDVVLFFKASWCPSCRAADKDIKANLSNIPAGVTILEVDYDTATELKKKYGVTQQHTFVKVDAAGNELNQWGGSRTLSDILAKL